MFNLILSLHLLLSLVTRVASASDYILRLFQIQDPLRYFGCLEETHKHSLACVGVQHLPTQAPHVCQRVFLSLLSLPLGIEALGLHIWQGLAPPVLAVASAR